MKKQISEGSLWRTFKIVKPFILTKADREFARTHGIGSPASKLDAGIVRLKKMTEGGEVFYRNTSTQVAFSPGRLHSLIEDGFLVEKPRM